MSTIIKGFSKLTREEKIALLLRDCHLSEDTHSLLEQFRIQKPEIQSVLNALSENSITNFPSPYGIAPNFLINNKIYHIPLVTEESSVVAASAKAAKTWAERGGFHARVKSVWKTGQVHFIWKGDKIKLDSTFVRLKERLLESTSLLTERMKQRGGGIRQIGLVDKTKEIPGYYQLFVYFDTQDAMGANFINSCLEAMAVTLRRFVQEHALFSEKEKELEIIMSILSNYNPECLTEVYVECPVDELEGIYEGLSAADYTHKFKLAVDIAKMDIHRAVTHNKGIFNGIDAVAIATGNDYRALEAGAHAYASRNGYYQGLSWIETTDKMFRFSVALPLAIGTVGGITGVHPLAQLSLKILGNPDVKDVMMIMAAAGLANHFAAIHALITSGIQKGHMKMHLSNILWQLQATAGEVEAAQQYFSDKDVSFSSVRTFLEKMSGEVG